MARRHLRMLAAATTAATALALVAAEPVDVEGTCTIGGAGMVTADRTRPETFHGEFSGVDDAVDGTWTHNSVEFGKITMTGEVILCRVNGEEIGDVYGTATIEGDPTVYEARLQVTEAINRDPRRPERYGFSLLAPGASERLFFIFAPANGRIDINY